VAVGLPEGKKAEEARQGSGGGDARIHYRGGVQATSRCHGIRQHLGPLLPGFRRRTRPSTAVKNPVTARPGADAARSSRRHLAVYVHFFLFFSGDVYLQEIDVRRIAGLCFNLPAQERELSEMVLPHGPGIHSREEGGTRSQRRNRLERAFPTEIYAFGRWKGRWPSTAAYAWSWSCGPFH
jgi:hypothetical protein